MILFCQIRKTLNPGNNPKRLIAIISLPIVLPIMLNTIAATIKLAIEKNKMQRVTIQAHNFLLLVIFFQAEDGIRD